MANQRDPDWEYTLIRHPVRKAMGITCNHYIVFDIYYQSQTHPRHTVDGWAKLTVGKIADFLGLSKSTVSEIAKFGIVHGFIEEHPETNRKRRTLAKWYDWAYLKNPTIEDLEFVRKSNVRKSVQKRSESEQERSEIEQKRSDSERHYIKEGKEVKRKGKEGDGRLFDIPETGSSNSLVDQAVELVIFYNEVTGQNRSHNRTGQGSTWVTAISKLLKTYSSEDIQDMILFKFWEFKDAVKTRQWIRPETFFVNNGAKYIDATIEAKRDPNIVARMKEAKQSETQSKGSIITDGEATREMSEVLADF